MPPGPRKPPTCRAASRRPERGHRPPLSGPGWPAAPRAPAATQAPLPTCSPEPHQPAGDGVVPVRTASAVAARCNPPAEHQASHQPGSRGNLGAAGAMPSRATSQAPASRSGSALRSTTGPVSVSTASARPAGHGPRRRISSTMVRSTRSAVPARFGRPTSLMAAERWWQSPRSTGGRP
jgi:hypothetical protein